MLTNRTFFVYNFRQGEDWHKIRSPLQQLLIKPRSAHKYLPKMEKCAEDFIDLMTILRDPQGEVPEFQDTMYRWAIECKNKDLKNVFYGDFKPYVI